MLLIRSWFLVFFRISAISVLLKLEVAELWSSGGLKLFCSSLSFSLLSFAVFFLFLILNRNILTHS
jgi:hypothetical protein